MNKLTILPLLFILLVAPSITLASSCDNLGSLDNYTDTELQSIFDACNKEIAQEKAALQNKKAQTQSISRDLSTIDSQIRKSNSYIKAKEIEIYRINKEIALVISSTCLKNVKRSSVMSSLVSLELRHAFGDHSPIESFRATFSIRLYSASRR